MFTKLNCVHHFRINWKEKIETYVEVFNNNKKIEVIKNEHTKLTELKGQLDKSTVTVVYLSTLLSVIHRTGRPKCKRLDDNIKQLN